MQIHLQYSLATDLALRTYLRVKMTPGTYLAVLYTKTNLLKLSPSYYRGLEQEYTVTIYFCEQKPLFARGFYDYF